jgi:hypothetical protein
MAVSEPGCPNRPGSPVFEGKNVRTLASGLYHELCH